MKEPEHLQAIRDVYKTESGKIMFDFMRKKACFDEPSLQASKDTPYEYAVAQGWMRDGVKKVVSDLVKIAESKPTKIARNGKET